MCVREHAKRTTVNIHISNFEWHEINVFHLIVTVISTHRDTVSRSLSRSISFALSPVIWKCKFNSALRFEKKWTLVNCRTMMLNGENPPSLTRALLIQNSIMWPARRFAQRDNTQKIFTIQHRAKNSESWQIKAYRSRTQLITVATNWTKHN